MTVVWEDAGTAGRYRVQIMVPQRSNSLSNQVSELSLKRRRHVSPDVVIYESPQTDPKWRDEYTQFGGLDDVDLPRRKLLFMPGDDLHSLTNAKPRRWTYKERVYLCVMYRYFANDFDDITLVFNKCFKSVVERRVLKSQYISELRWYGYDRAWVQVNRDTAFANIGEKWEAVIEELEACAAMCSVELVPRSIDPPDLFAKEAKPRSPGTIKRLRQLKKLSKVPISLSDDEEEDGYDESTHSPTSDASLLVVTPSTLPSSQASQSPESPLSSPADSVASPFQHLDRPRFTFRCDHATSGTIRDARGLIGGEFDTWPNLERKTWPTADDICLQDQVIRHIWRSDSSRPYSTLVSTSTSLLELFRRAVPNIETATISVIEYAKIANHTYHAESLIRRLKPTGNFIGMHYKGTCEYLTYSYIPNGAIVHEFKFADLQNRLVHAGYGAAILERVVGKHVSTVKRQMFESPIPADNRGAGLIGIIASFFGVTADSDSDYVQLIVVLLMDALVIEFAIEPTEVEIDSIVQHFVSELLRQPDGNFAPLDDSHFHTLKSGFILGLVQGHQKLKIEKHIQVEHTICMCNCTSDESLLAITSTGDYRRSGFIKLA
ncbi:hypothetical protein EJ05DRAFT_541073 [Pseudovirgaria hyperparasitica]|uniref:DUF7587 domain-containing protein n=1 Tax=Pseudovirgaria hyperparasitica TaxID=470096 RepID=A0A6A6VXR0_9PEZI|nr:uncharacterized protein EJ05DRAFT_541073 [Pseudovirgaria hyperparasitica]KAF2754474.1 hypothetical protein EJ05DRAFT_541073 [Pseudovirgaria hyperparasitica]